MSPSSISGRVGSLKSLGRTNDQKERLRSKARARSLPKGISLRSPSRTSTTSTVDGRRSLMENWLTFLVALAVADFMEVTALQDTKKSGAAMQIDSGLSMRCGEGDKKTFRIKFCNKLISVFRRGFCAEFVTFSKSTRNEDQEISDGAVKKPASIQGAAWDAGGYVEVGGSPAIEVECIIDGPRCG